jgi:large subunit ribosomal protein L5
MQLSEKINKEIMPKMAQETGKPLMSLPRLKKVVITVGVGPFRERKDVLDSIEKELTLISGQKPKFTIAKKSISGFKLREGQTVGYQVTLRSKRMWDFVERLVSVVLPRLRDFDGVSTKSFDRAGNLNVAVKEQIIFPEIKADEVKENWGLQVNFVLDRVQNIETAQKYFKELGLIFK